ncbi:MAG TPA: DUF3142 domain-containing protein [Chthonomonadaceae bacterium]|nr:DUF3142 domain-containing protein [Chthonomonadaceae bacterium]
MGRRRRVAIWLAALMGMLAGGSLLWQRLRAPRPPLEVALWYWHQPFRLPPAEAAQLRALGVRQLFVRAGTFRKEGNGARLILAQQWAGKADGLAIHLVFNFDYDIVRHFGALSNEALAAAIREGVRRERARAERAGIHIAGVQLDFDCPTRRLSKYAELLRQLRATLLGSGAFSITALPTWFTDGDVQQVLNAVDFVVPQYYEAQIPKTLAEFKTVSRLRMAERGLASLGRTGRPFYAGVPAYGHALLYDDRGSLAGLYRALSALDAAHHPSFRLARAFPADSRGRPATPATYIGEDIYDFVAVSPARDGRGKGYHLVYDLPTPALVAQHLALVRAQGPANCRGIILFRYPESVGAMTLPLPALAAAIRGETARPSLRVQIKAASAPWELIETGRDAARAPIDLTLAVTNTGTATTFLAPDAITLTLHFDRPGLEEADPRDFDSLEAFFDGQSRPASSAAVPPLRASLPRANGLRLRKFQLAAGETARIGPIRVPADGARQVWGAWSATGPGGFNVVRGDIPPTPLAPEATNREKPDSAAALLP